MLEHDVVKVRETVRVKESAVNSDLEFEALPFNLAARARPELFVRIEHRTLDALVRSLKKDRPRNL